MECRADSNFGPDADVTAVVCDYTVSDGKPQTGPFTDRFGSEEWIEDAPERGLIHTITGVSDAKFKVLAE